jgi:hypothetical protein
METIHDSESINLGVAQAPSGFRDNVFDYYSGLRLIVSRERTPWGKIVVHISASVMPNSPLWLELTGHTLSMVECLDEILKRWHYISREKKNPEFVGFSAGGVPHWVLELD